MERQRSPGEETAIAKAISIMDWEGPSLPGEENSSINPDQGIVHDSRNEPTHPLRRGRIKRGLPAAPDIADPTNDPRV